MGLPKCLSGYSSISGLFTDRKKQMNFLGILTCRSRSRAARTIARASRPYKITITCSCNLERKLHWISISLPKAFYIHTLIFLVSISSSQFLWLNENIWTIWQFFIQAKRRKIFFEPFSRLQNKHWKIAPFFNKKYFTSKQNINKT